jgi:hypothetical protein
MPTRSIHLSEDEAHGLQQLRDATGQTEDRVLERVLERGLQELRFEAAVKAFRDGRGSSEAAVIAGLPRAIFLEEMAERGETILDGPSTLASGLSVLADHFGDARLAEVARRLTADEQ